MRRSTAVPVRPLKRRLTPEQRASRLEKIARRAARPKPEPTPSRGYWNREQCAARGIKLKPSKLVLGGEYHKKGTGKSVEANPLPEGIVPIIEKTVEEIERESQA